ncbi:hypothetical protein LTR35_017605 [Friedmanniomyces endolithicus]|uniref:AMP-dependent synthetase/ligase domain-containing protein n=1 Tax=Friedmanniomyces endolithicus TaxID=329885 RepID=A0AAN6F570_9PEZI|nr:hypothetical protein LTR35_017605 [Friedmanniomyces endolithicus]KAK0268588.1 hypothetical protein LTS00_017533 [Friedmanniomyces endolithicus]KAK0302076.1 hypothetical protein LTR01_008978 [Friedmanniomyces endolithicus]KAK0304468.1 hypothetical protein LTR82_017181 [Friedmanniomyces endolithicus]KAK0972507.1 hypothetical protein LTR54_017565 [Friedmanniomyces endolithicus]
MGNKGIGAKKSKLGYWNNEEATKNAITSDGYFKTGDVGHQDKDRNFYITDRMKELIKWNGFQVAPAELEGLLLDLPLEVPKSQAGKILRRLLKGKAEEESKNEKRKAKL